MQNIHVKRYETPTVWAGSIEPEDRSWIVFIAADGASTFWRRANVDHKDIGDAEHGYVDAELPTGCCNNSGVPLETQSPLPVRNPLDFEVTTQGSKFFAILNARDIAGEGATEHEAIQNLLNYVAQLCVAGSLDHTGAAVIGRNQRRYQAVFG